jgi:REP element-mobilizing transposase RayT
MPKDACYFITLNVVDWADLFTRLVYRKILADSLNHFVENTGLTIYAWCLMTNQLHLVIKTKDGFGIALFERDFKKFTTPEIIKAIDHVDLRQDWLLERFENYSKSLRKIEKYHLWQDSSSPVHIDCGRQPELLADRISFIHEIPVRELIVESPEHYLFSSARDYTGQQGIVHVSVVPLKGTKKFKSLSSN